MLSLVILTQLTILLALLTLCDSCQRDGARVRPPPASRGRPTAWQPPSLWSSWRKTKKPPRIPPTVSCELRVVSRPTWSSAGARWNHIPRGGGRTQQEPFPPPEEEEEDPTNTETLASEALEAADRITTRPLSLQGVVAAARGGGAAGRIAGKSLISSSTTTLSPTRTSSRFSSSILPTPQRAATLVLVSIAAGLLYTYRAVWMPWLDKDRVQHATLHLLQQLRGDPADPWSLWKAWFWYTLGMTAWEFVGLSTVPVETSAGMALGLSAAVPSLVGKLLGATLAFYCGRYLWADAARRQLASNRFFQLLNPPDEPLTTTAITTTASIASSQKKPNPRNINNSVGVPPPPSILQKKRLAHPPLLTAFLMKYSVFPEPVKNFGSSLLTVIEPWMFVVATTVHGGSFTLLWTWLGVDTARRLQVTSTAGQLGQMAVPLPPNRPLQVALAAAFVVGFILTPMAMAWWLGELQRFAKENGQDDDGLQ